MDWKSLNKEQKQLVVLSTLALVTLLYVGKTFVIGPMSKKWKQANIDIKELSQKVRVAETFNQEDGKVLQDIKKTYLEIAKTDKEFLADEANKFAWAAALTYKVGREVGLELEVADAKVAGRTAGTASTVADFVPYSVNVNTECSYDQLVILLKKIEKISPYTSISNLSIVANPSDFNKHSISFKVQWPLFQNPNKRDKILKS